MQIAEGLVKDVGLAVTRLEGGCLHTNPGQGQSGREEASLAPRDLD